MATTTVVTSQAKDRRAIGMVSAFLLSVLILVVVPTLFWLGVAWLVLEALGIGLSKESALALAAVASGVLVPVWAVLLMGKRTDGETGSV
ncbi:MAG: hypothetical protein ACFCUN_09820 [Hyphomicrobiaceae bacterium]